MKLKFWPVLIFSLCLTLTAAYAVERLSVEPALPQSQTSSDSFRAVVTGDGKLVLKPGAVFTEGVEAAGTELPYLLSAPKAIAYPRWALRQGWQGDLVAAVEILADGTVGRSSVMTSTGYEILDKTAMEAMKTWKFQPAMKEGRPFLSCIQIPVRFQIDTQE